MILCRIIAMGMLLAAAQGRKVTRNTDVADRVKVVTYNIGAENEDIYDPAMEWFYSESAYQMINLVRVEYSETDGIKFIKCVGFSHADLENNCPEEPSSSAHSIENFLLESDEYIDFVSGDSFLNILAIYFRTNKGREFGPFGTETDPAKHMFKLSHDTDAPLLYVEGLKGLWVYSLYFSFHEVNVLKLENITNDMANETYLALNGEIDDLYVINDAHKRLYPDIARKGCAYWYENPSIEAQIACDFEVLMDQVNILTKGSIALQEHAPRNLLTLKDYDSAKYLDEVKEAADFHNLLTEVQFGLNTVIDVTEQQSAELSAFFSSAAAFDQAIAEQDLLYIQGQIELKSEGSAIAAANVAERLEFILISGVTITLAELMFEIYEFTTTIVMEFNPANLIIGGGPSLGDVFEAMEDLMSAAQDVVTLSVLLGYLEEWCDQLQVVADGFAENQAAVDAMAEMVEILANETDPDVIQVYADEYIKAYGDYTPQVSNQDIVYIVTLLDTVGIEACAIIEGIDTTSPVIVPIIAVALEHCTYAPAEIAVLGSYYEDFYTLQFEMIDALTSIVRGQISIVMADRIGAIETTIDMRTAAIGSCMVEVTYQAASLSRCDILEYLAAGKRPTICEKLLFRDEDIQNLIAYTGSMSASFRNVFAFIPTVYQNDSVGIPFINITDLLRGGFQKIRLPHGNIEWLREYDWLPGSYDPETAFFVSTMEMYIPGLKCNETGESIHTVRVEALSSNPTYLYSEDAPPKYSVDKHLVNFEYTEPSDYCAGEVREYPVVDSTLQTQYDQEICIVSMGDIHVLPKDDFAYPSLFTTWTISLTGHHDCTLVEDETLTFQPLITVRLVTKEVLVKESPNDPGINECWPTGTRCPEGETCVDELLDYCCQDSQGVCD